MVEWWRTTSSLNSTKAKTELRVFWSLHVHNYQHMPFSIDSAHVVLLIVDRAHVVLLLLTVPM